jgi:hypothetical protein
LHRKIENVYLVIVTLRGNSMIPCMMYLQKIN